ncbi:hypothetical protein F0562_013793 [Nyssa sinensis]|uniref:Uncharacterized protein n=1 Tax=Nyssa sinensis TaxID=561372 RepID=A0A5J4ZL64_9ASTE|nr:hypothetical protein F0562_013793 [Nyssa sinensis]
MKRKVAPVDSVQMENVNCKYIRTNGSLPIQSNCTSNLKDTTMETKAEEGKFGCNISHLGHFSDIAEKSIEKFVSVMSSFRYSSSGSRASGLRAPLKDVDNTSTSRSTANVDFSDSSNSILYQWVLLHSIILWFHYNQRLEFDALGLFVSFVTLMINVLFMSMPLIVRFRILSAQLVSYQNKPKSSSPLGLFSSVRLIRDFEKPMPVGLHPVFLPKHVLNFENPNSLASLTIASNLVWDTWVGLIDNLLPLQPTLAYTSCILALC